MKIFFSYKDGWVVCEEAKAKCDHFSIKTGKWNGGVGNLPADRPIKWMAVIGLLDTV